MEELKKQILNFPGYGRPQEADGDLKKKKKIPQAMEDLKKQMEDASADEKAEMEKQLAVLAQTEKDLQKEMQTVAATANTRAMQDVKDEHGWPRSGL
jgi:hypothetical protein